MKFRKVVALLMALTMVMSFLVGCNGDSEENEMTGTGSLQTEQPDLEPPMISKDPITLEIHLHINDRVFSEEMAVFKKAAERTNVHLIGTLSAATIDATDAFNVMMLSGKVTDIVMNLSDEINEYGQEGAFLALNDLIDQHAPNIKKMLEEEENVRKHVTAEDGNIYGIPWIPDGMTAEGYFIRQDWLDIVGKDVPTTVDELYDVLLAFRDEDPNGNNEKDEVPFISRAWFRTFNTIAALQGVLTGIHVKDGKVCHGMYSEDAKKVYSFARKLYEENILDLELFTRTGDARLYFFAENKGGFIHDWFASTSSYNDNQNVKSRVPDFNLIPMLPPADVNGDVWEYTSRDLISNRVWAIGAENEHPVETIKYFDYWFSEEGRRLANFGVEGVHYTMVDGRPVFTDEICNGEKPLVDLLRDDGAQLEFGFKQDYWYEAQMMTPIAAEMAEKYIEENVFNPYKLPYLTYNADEQTVISQKEKALETFMNEAAQNFMLGNWNVEDDFDEFLSRMESLGVEELIEVRQSAYERYLAK